MKSKLNKRRGFTIVEIIVAVTIMAALMTIVFRSLQRAQKSANRSTYQARIREDAVVYAQEAKRLQDDSIGTPNDIQTILNNHVDSDPAGGTYTFAFNGTTLTLIPGATLRGDGVHPEIVKINP